MSYEVLTSFNKIVHCLLSGLVAIFSEVKISYRSGNRGTRYSIVTTEKHRTKEDYSLVADDWIAEYMSLSPERTMKIPRISSSWDALVVLYITSHLSDLYWITDDVHRQLAHKAYVANYEGEWETVQMILEQYPKTPKEFYDLFIMKHSPEEFFGNLVRRADRLSRYLDSKPRDPHGPVRKPQRHRGYRDKGTLRPSHRPAVIPPSDDDRVDRRNNVGHPLLRMDSVEDFDGKDHLPPDRRKE